MLFKDRHLGEDLKRGAVVHFAAGLAATVLLAGAVALLIDGPLAGLLVSALVYAVFVGAIFRFLGDHRPHDRFGAANRITLMRSALVANIAAAATFPAGLAWQGWSLTALLVVAFALDGVDGWAARRRRLESRFGARFDQELDGLFTLVLAVLILRTGKAGAWVLLAGAWHYFFYALRVSSPIFRKSLPYSYRRKLVCGVVVAALVAAASPLLLPPYSDLVALGAVALLSLSFAVDIAWLWRLSRSENLAATQQGLN